MKLLKAIWAEPSGLLFYLGAAVFVTAPAWLYAIAVYTRS